MVSPIGAQQSGYNYTKHLALQANPVFGQGYWLNTVGVVPTEQTSQTAMTTSAQAPIDPNCTDGKDDGSIGFFSALGHALKGGVKFFTGMFTDDQGNFSLGQTLKTLAIGGAIAAATCIPVVGPLVLPALCTLGIIQGGTKVISGITNAMDAQTDAEAKQAWEEIGNGATEGIVSYTGYKATGGWKANINKAKTQYTTKFGDLSDKTASHTRRMRKHHSNNSQVSESNSGSLAEEARRNSINEQAAKVDRGESTAHTNEEIRQTVDNIDTSRLNGNDRAMVDKAAQDIPTEAQQKAYDKQMEYRPATEAQRKAFEDKGGKFVEHETGNATQSLSEFEIKKSSKPEVKTLDDVKAQIEKSENAPKVETKGMTTSDIKAQIETTGKIPDGEYLVEMPNKQTGIYRVKDGNIEIVDQAGTKITSKTKELRIAEHKAKVENQIKTGHFEYFTK